MAVYYAYTVFDITTHFFLLEGLVGVVIDEVDLNAEIAAATTWVEENISFAAANVISLRRLETTEGGYRGIDSKAIIAAFGTITDAAVAQGAAGTLHAKVRKISSQLNDLATTGFALNAGANLIGKVQLRDPGNSTDLGDAINPIRTDPTGTTPQPITGTVAISGTPTVSAPQLPASLTGNGYLATEIAYELPAGTQVIGKVDVNSAPTGTSAQQVQGTAATGAAVVGKPVYVAGKDYSGNLQPIAMGADGSPRIDYKTGKSFTAKASGSSSEQALSAATGLKLFGILIRETAASTAKITFRHGTTGSDPILGFANLTSDGDKYISFGDRGLLVPNGVYSEKTSGSTETVFYHAIVLDA